MKQKITLILLLLPILIFAQEAWKDYFPKPAGEFNPKKYVCYKTSDVMEMDGKLDEKAWGNAEFTNYFVDIEGDLKPKPYYQTQVKMLWDDDYMYFACQMEEPHIWAKLKERDSVIFFDNDFEIFIDPNGDTHNYFEFEMNAFNTVWDLLLLKPYYRSKLNVAVDSWDIQGLKTGVDINGTLNDPSDTDKSWSLEVAIPWKVMEEAAGNKPKDGQQWRVNFSRVEWDTEVVDGDYVKLKNPEHNWVWSPQGIIAMHYPEMWGFVQFSENEVGTEKADFVWNQEEDVKWFLRQIYYAQQTFVLKQDRFATNLDELGLEPLLMKGASSPEFYSTPSLFEVVINFEGNSYHIMQDGLTWKEEGSNKIKD